MGRTYLMAACGGPYGLLSGHSERWVSDFVSPRRWNKAKELTLLTNADWYSPATEIPEES